jgi:glycosyltransferase involved in cell wall biosynthesis
MDFTPETPRPEAVGNKMPISSSGPGHLNWAIVSGVYDPGVSDHGGGVSDYTRTLANGMAAAGDHVTVYAPVVADVLASHGDANLIVLPGMFGGRALSKLDNALSCSKPDRVLVQYVPQAFGCKAMNLPFCLWLFVRRRRYRIWVMFHEVAVGVTWKQPLRRNLLGVVTHLMALLAARSAERIFVSIPAWQRMLQPMLPPNRSVSWAPIPSNIPVVSDRKRVAQIRARYAPAEGLLLGHFGTYGQLVGEPLGLVLPHILSFSPTAAVLLLGKRSAAFRNLFLARHPEFTGRVHASGALSAEELSCHLSACDVMVQPYPDGISTRRTSVMASLAHGIAVATTIGCLSEPFWRESNAVLLSPADDSQQLARVTAELLDSPARRRTVGMTGKELYNRRFAIEHTIAAMRARDINIKTIIGRAASS